MTNKKLSKRLSYILRHAPEKADLELDVGGWVAIADLLAGFAGHGWDLNRDLLERVVQTNDKKRFTISEDGLRIRAAQGHSVKIESDLVPTSPPAQLYHGTATQFLDAIMEDGLKPMSRQHVHLSLDRLTATKVGQRHGKPVILTVQADEMQSAGFEFYQADNGVWLTMEVPAQYLAQAQNY